LNDDRVSIVMRIADVRKRDAAQPQFENAILPTSRSTSTPTSIATKVPRHRYVMILNPLVFAIIRQRFSPSDEVLTAANVDRA
jgi:hypothetical protein